MTVGDNNSGFKVAGYFDEIKKVLEKVSFLPGLMCAMK